MTGSNIGRTGPGGVMRVALADDSAVVRAGLASWLDTVGREVVVTARTGDELLARLAGTPADAVILDIRMPPTFTDEGLVTAARIRAHHATTGILLLSTYTETDYAARLMELPGGGVGYLLKDRVDDKATLVDALDRVTAGESVIDPGIVSRLFARRRRRDVVAELTERERDVLRLMAEGRSNAGISSELFLSVKTVETHVAALFGKLGLHADTTLNRRVLAVLTWLRNGTPAPP